MIQLCLFDEAPTLLARHRGQAPLSHCLSPLAESLHESVDVEFSHHTSKFLVTLRLSPRRAGRKTRAAH